MLRRRLAAIFLVFRYRAGFRYLSACQGQNLFVRNSAQGSEGELAGYWGVKKDSGDDPDVTNGTWICAAVAPVSRG